MKNLLQKVYDAESFRQQGHELVDILANYLLKIEQGEEHQVIPYAEPEDMLDYWKNDLEQTTQENGKESELLSSLFERIIAQNIHTLHPKYMGHQVASPPPLNALTDFFASFMNSGLGVYEMGSPMVALERIVVQEFTKNIGYRSNADGFLTSGGSLGNLTALLTARSVKTENAWMKGNTKQQLAILVSEEAHYSVQRAVKIMGWGEEGIVKVPVDKEYRLDVTQLETCYKEAIDKGKKIVAVVANACSTATGAYDNLSSIADFCEKYQVWFHVDAAHGGGVIFSGKYRSIVNGIERADSVIIDFHKMLLTSALTTGVFYKDGANSYKTFTQEAHYLWEKSKEYEWYNLGKRTFECTKSTMSLNMYTLLKMYGTELFEAHIDSLYDLAKECAKKLEQEIDFELLAHPQSNILCFRFIPGSAKDGVLNTINRKIRQRIVEKGRFYIVQTQIQKKIYLRITLMSVYTSLEDFILLLKHIREIYKKIII